MAKYRGKYSRSVSDDSHTERQPISNLQQPVSRQADQDTSQRFEPVSVGSKRRVKSSARTERTSDFSESSRARRATPGAFKHHDAVQENGMGKRHSKRKTLLIALPIILVLAVAVAGVVFAVSSCSSEEVTIEPGIAVTVTIPQGSSTNEIANILKKAQVISSTQDFITEVQSINAEQSLKPGTYELVTLMDLPLLVDTLVAGPVENGTRLTIPEGLTAEQTAEMVEASCGIAQADFLALVYSADTYLADYPFLEGVYNNSLEGFLYPKTYSIPEDATADTIIRILLDQFAIETSELDLSYATEHGMNLFNVVTMGSLIEKETAADDERPLVASVMYNRLREGMKLQIDATIVYILGSDFTAGEVSYDDLEIESPYNTYLVYELPAGPICSPSIASLEAAAHPAETNYFYYVLTSTEGYHTFCETEEEFLVAKEEYNRLFGVE